MPDKVHGRNLAPLFLVERPLSFSTSDRVSRSRCPRKLSSHQLNLPQLKPYRRADCRAGNVQCCDGRNLFD